MSQGREGSTQESERHPDPLVSDKVTSVVFVAREQLQALYWGESL